MLHFLAAAQNAVETDAMPPPETNMWQSLIMIVVAMLFLYFIMWRPEQKRRKELENLRTQLKKGDKVTAMGVVGSVLRIEESTVILKMYDGSKLEFLKGAISEVLPADQDVGKGTDKQAVPANQEIKV